MDPVHRRRRDRPLRSRPDRARRRAGDGLAPAAARRPRRPGRPDRRLPEAGHLPRARGPRRGAHRWRSRPAGPRRRSTTGAPVGRPRRAELRRRRVRGRDAPGLRRRADPRGVRLGRVPRSTTPHGPRERPRRGAAGVPRRAGDDHGDDGRGVGRRRGEPDPAGPGVRRRVRHHAARLCPGPAARSRAGAHPGRRAAGVGRRRGGVLRPGPSDPPLRRFLGVTPGRFRDR